MARMPLIRSFPPIAARTYPHPMLVDKVLAKPSRNCEEDDANKAKNPAISPVMIPFRATTVAIVFCIDIIKLGVGPNRNKQCFLNVCVPKIYYL